MMFIKGLSYIRSPAGPAGKLSILIFHRVFARTDPLFPGEVDAIRFDQILSWLAQWFNVLPLSEAVERMTSGTLPARAASITFDDGYADNYAVALPILQRHRMTATFFIASGFLDGGRMFNDSVIEAVRGFEGEQLDLARLDLGLFETRSLDDRRRTINALLSKLKYLPIDERSRKVSQLCDYIGVTLPDDLMMSSGQLRSLHGAGMEIGGHTRSHPILARLSDEAAREEIIAGKHHLETIIGQPLSLFAYPNGKPGQDYLASHVRMVNDAGFTAAVSTSAGAASRFSDRFQLPRFTPWDRTQLRFGLRMVVNMKSGGMSVK